MQKSSSSGVLDRMCCRHKCSVWSRPRVTRAFSRRAGSSVPLLAYPLCTRRPPNAQATR
jgi:hypothetical protein